MVSRLCGDGVQGRDGRCVENSSCFQIFLFVPVCILLLGSSAGLISALLCFIFLLFLVSAHSFYQYLVYRLIVSFIPWHLPNRKSFQLLRSSCVTRPKNILPDANVSKGLAPVTSFARY